MSLRPAFEEIAKKKNISGKITAISGCPPLLNIYSQQVEQKWSCRLLNKRVYNYVKDNSIKTVFLVARWTYYTDGWNDNQLFIWTDKNDRSNQETSRQAFVKGLSDTIDEYSKIGVKVIVISQVPQQLYEPANIFYRFYEKDGTKFIDKIHKFSITTQQHKEHNFYVESIFKDYQNRTNFRWISLDNTYCLQNNCLIASDKESYYSYYRDNNHLSDIGARLAISEIAKHI